MPTPSRSHRLPVLALALGIGVACGCSLLTDLDGLATGDDAGTVDAGSDVAIDAAVDAADVRDAGLFVCRPGFSGEGCAVACPMGRAGLACEYELAYSLDIPTLADWKVAADVPYAVKPAPGIGAIRRVAYRLTLDADDVWVEMDAFTQEVTKLGVPVDDVFQEPVRNVLVFAFSSKLSHVLVPTAGNIEFWSHCYSEGPDGDFDDSDELVVTEPDCFGSMQLHVAGSPVLSFNHWSSGSSAVDLGVGKSTKAGESDWTFAKNAATFQKRRLEIYVLK